MEAGGKTTGGMFEQAPVGWMSSGVASSAMALDTKLPRLQELGIQYTGEPLDLPILSSSDIADLVRVLSAHPEKSYTQGEREGDIQGTTSGKDPRDVSPLASAHVEPCLGPQKLAGSKRRRPARETLRVRGAPRPCVQPHTPGAPVTCDQMPPGPSPAKGEPRKQQQTATPTIHASAAPGDAPAPRAPPAGKVSAQHFGPPGRSKQRHAPEGSGALVAKKDVAWLRKKVQKCKNTTRKKTHGEASGTSTRSKAKQAVVVKPLLADTDNPKRVDGIETGVASREQASTLPVEPCSPGGLQSEPEDLRSYLEQLFEEVPSPKNHLDKPLAPAPVRPLDQGGEPGPPLRGRCDNFEEPLGAKECGGDLQVAPLVRRAALAKRQGVIPFAVSLTLQSDWFSFCPRSNSSCPAAPSAAAQAVLPTDLCGKWTLQDSAGSPEGVQGAPPSGATGVGTSVGSFEETRATGMDPQGTGTSGGLCHNDVSPAGEVPLAGDEVSPVPAALEVIASDAAVPQSAAPLSSVMRGPCQSEEASRGGHLISKEEITERRAGQGISLESVQGFGAGGATTCPLPLVIAPSPPSGTLNSPQPAFQCDGRYRHFLLPLHQAQSVAPYPSGALHPTSMDVDPALPQPVVSQPTLSPIADPRVGLRVPSQQLRACSSSPPAPVADVIFADPRHRVMAEVLPRPASPGHHLGAKLSPGLHEVHLRKGEENTETLDIVNGDHRVPAGGVLAQEALGPGNVPSPLHPLGAPSNHVIRRIAPDQASALVHDPPGMGKKQRGKRGGKKAREKELQLLALGMPQDDGLVSDSLAPKKILGHVQEVGLFAELKKWEQRGKGPGRWGLRGGDKMGRMAMSELFQPRAPDKVPCRFWKMGMCNKGLDCSFKHEGERGVPPRPPICKYHRVGRCDQGDNCKFSHDLAAEPCKHWTTTGRCPYGEKCAYSHEPVAPEVAEQIRQELLQAEEVAMEAHQIHNVWSVTGLVGADDEEGGDILQPVDLLAMS